ncbi:MAG: hypothetical protein R3Y07_02125 [Eubacteriales bacterium]
MSKKNDNVVTSIYITKQQLEDLDKLSNSLDITRTELIRSLISKGLSVQGYAQDIDLITNIIRQELQAIYRPDEIRSMMNEQVNRIAKMLMKVGKMEAGSYFLLVKVILHIWPTAQMEEVFELIRDTQELGIGFMQCSDGDINRYLQDTEQVMRVAKGLATES